MTPKLADADRRLSEICAEIGRDPASIRRAVQLEWNGADPGVLIESSARWLEAGFTEQIVYLKPPGALRTAEAAAATLDELRALAARSSPLPPD